MLMGSAAALAETRITLVLSDTSAAYREAASSLADHLSTDRARWRVRREDTASRRGPGDEDLRISLGPGALRTLLAENTNTPIWALMLSRDEFQSIANTSSFSDHIALSALYMDQPRDRQLTLVRVALPQARRVAVFTRDDPARILPSLHQAAGKLGLEVQVERILAADGVITALRRLRKGTDVLLLDDADMPDSSMLKPLLLETYGRNLPVVVSTTRLLQAGAMLALYTSPDSIAREAAARLARMRPGARLRPPATAFPDNFDVAVNRSVALALDIRVATAEALRQRMLRRAGE